MSVSRTLYLLRHARSQPSRDQPEASWPLSVEGAREAAALVPVLSTLGIDAIYSSPYARAVATVAPFARSSGLDVCEVPALRERRVPWVEDRDFFEVIERAFAEPASRPNGGESNAECAIRMRLAVGDLLSRHPGQNLLLSGHGNALAIYLGTLEPAFGFAAWRAMTTPDLYAVCLGASGRPPGRPRRVAL